MTPLPRLLFPRLEFLRSRRPFIKALIATIAPVAVLTAAPAQAAIYTWTGSSGTDWATNGNWAPSGIPSADTSAVIFTGVNGAGSTTLTNTITGANTIGTDKSLTSITFDSDSLAYTMTGNAFRIGASGGAITNDSAFTQTFSNTGGIQFTGSAAPFALNSADINVTTGVVNAANANLTLTVNGPGHTLFLGGFNLSNNTTNRTNTINGTGNVTINGEITNGSSAASGLIYAGKGALTLNSSMANSYTGTTQVNSGTMALDYSNIATPTDLVNNASALMLSGGTLSIKGKSGAATTSQTFASTRFNTNTASAFRVSQNGATAVSVTLGLLTRNAGSTVDFTLPSAGEITTGTTAGTGPNNINGNGIAYSTVNATTWLTNNGGTLGALGAAAYDTNGFAGGDTDVTVSSAPGVFTTNTLRFNTAGKTLTVDSSGTSIVTAGGILVTAAGTSSVIASAGDGAGLTAGATGKEIIIHNYGDLTVSAPIVNNGGNAVGVTNTGTGITTLSGANTYTGATVVNAGTLAVTGTLGNTAINVSGGTLSLQAAGAVSQNTLTVNAGGTLNNTAVNGLSGAANLALTGGTAVLSKANNFTGAITLGNQATNSLVLSDPNAIASASSLAATGGTISLLSNSSVTFNTPNFNTTGGSPTINVDSLDGTTTGQTITISGSETIRANGTINVTGGHGYTLNLPSVILPAGFNTDTIFPSTANVTVGSVTNSNTTAGTTNLGLGGSSTANFVTGVIGNGTGGAITGVNKKDTSTWTLSAANTYSGATALNGGQLNINNAGSGGTSSAIGTGLFTISSGAFDNTSGGDLTLSTNNVVSIGAGGFTFGGTNSLNFGTGAVTVTQNNTTVTLGGTNTNLTFGGTATNTNTGSNITFTANGAGNSLTLGGYAISNGAALKNLIISGSADVAITGAVTDSSSTATLSTLTYSGTGKLTLSGANTYTGKTSVTSGTLQMAKQVSLYNNSVASWTAANIIVNSGATLALNVGGAGEFTSDDVDTLKALGSATTGFKSGSFLGLDTSNASGGNFVYNSNISNPNGRTLGLAKLGANTLTLTGSSNYTGATNVNGGTLLVNGDINGTSTVNVASGATLGGSGTITTANGGNVVLATGSKLSPGASAGNFTLALGNGLLDVAAVGLANAGSFVFELGVNSDKVILSTGSLIIGAGSFGINDLTIINSGGLAAGSYTLFDTSSPILGSLDPSNITGSLGNGFFGTLVIDNINNDVDLIVVPEPSSITAILGGLGLLLGLTRIRRRAAI